MTTIVLKPLFHREAECIGIYAEPAKLPSGISLNYYFQNKAGARWSRTNRCWWIPCTEKNYEQLCSALKGKALLEVQELKKYLLDREKGKPVAVAQIVATRPLTLKPLKKIINAQQRTIIYKLSADNNEALQKFKQQLILKSYSQSTIRTYENEFRQFLQTIKDVPASDFTTQRIKDYLQYCFKKLKLSENTLHSRMNALKFYYEQVLKREKFFWEIPRPKKPLQLPKVLGEDELRKLFNAITYKKHKAILFTAYSAGLRVSEVVNLQLKHIDRSRMQLFVEKSKGKKDRYVGLSKILLDILESYYKEIKVKPVKYLFEGENPGVAYHARSAQKVFQMAKYKAGINKEIGFHSLRHSFATHLLEKGIDIKYIKDLLGHFDIRTTERYLHVKKEKLINIVSPLDDLWQKEEIDW
jgi:site-specific recombinase XerD